MTNSRSTKRALIASVISILLCVSMLLGTTYAWFTDSVTSANNVIVSGNLDVELEYWNGTEWVSVEGKSDILTNKFFEPGATEVAYLRVANAGSLALKYQLGVNIVSETEGKNVAGKNFKLSDYVMFGVVEGVNGETGAYADRADAVADVANAQKISAGYTKADAMAVNTELYLALVVYMPTNVGNEANHNGTDIPEINLGINVVATQVENEDDSFGKDYDKEAVWADTYVTDAAELADALANAEDGETIALMDDVVLSDVTRAAASNFAFNIAKGKNVVLNLNGKKITKTVSNSDINGDGKFTSADNRGIFQVKGNLTVVGDGIITMVDTGANMEWNALSAAFSVESGTLTLGEGVTVVHNGGTDMAYAVDVNTTLGETVLNVNGAVLSSTYVGVRVFNNHKTEKGIVNYNSGIIAGENRDLWTQIMSAPAENAVVNTKIAYTTNDAGDRYYFDVATVVGDGSSLSTGLANDEDVVFVDDITFTGTKQLPDRNNYVEAYGNKVGFAQYGGVIDGNGNTLTDAEGDRSYVIVTHGGTIKNLVITTGARGIVTYSPTENVYIDNVVVDGAGYALNSTEHGAVKLVVTNSTINGWTSLAGFTSVVFEDCKLGENTSKYWQSMGYGQDYDRLFRVYSPTSFTNCEFEQGYYLDMSAGGTATLTNCTVNGVVITAENYADYITVEIPSGKTLSDCVSFN